MKLAALIAAAVLAGVPAGGRLPGATSFKVCAGAGPYWPTMTLALAGSSAWVACKADGRIVRISTTTGKIGASIRTAAPVIAVAAGFGTVWALDTSSTLYRIEPVKARVTKRVDLGASAPYNIWAGGSSVWVVDDRVGEVIRVSPETNRVVARLTVGDGPADLVFGDGSAWVINHRDRGLVRIDLGTNPVTRVARIPGDAPERMARLAGSLWISGRGTDLLQVDPRTGAVAATIEIGASGIDVVASGNSLWVPVRSAAVDPSGFPTMDALLRVSASTPQVSTVARPTGRLDVHGLQFRAGRVWIADNRSGTLCRVRG